jgi:hypothetical protein
LQTLTAQAQGPMNIGFSIIVLCQIVYWTHAPVAIRLKANYPGIYYWAL